MVGKIATVLFFPVGFDAIPSDADGNVLSLDADGYVLTEDGAARRVDESGNELKWDGDNTAMIPVNAAGAPAGDAIAGGSYARSLPLIVLILFLGGIFFISNLDVLIQIEDDPPVTGRGTLEDAHK